MKVRLSLLCLIMQAWQFVAGQPLEEKFKRPMSEAKPIMIWQWMDGLVTREGITADLEAYKEAGIGGVQNFQIGGRLQCHVGDTANAIGTEKWKQLMRYAIGECKRLGLSFGTHNCPGWSSSAYPTVKPEYSMQKLVWTDSIINGGKKVHLKVTQPQVDPQWNYYQDIALLAIPADSLVRLEDVRILQKGTLTEQSSFTINLPKGQWRVFRFGHTTTGKTNWGTAPESGVGLECDKMSREAVKLFWADYPMMLIDLAGEETGKTFQRLEIDSYEAGGQEWTRLMPDEFLKRRGYDMLCWLPVIAGVTIDDNMSTHEFMDDWKETVCDLFAENYYGYMSQLAHQYGLKLLVQPYGTGAAKPFNPINAEKIISHLPSDDPISAEFWVRPETWGWPDVPRIVNAAHQAGRKKVYAEGFTCWPLYAWKAEPDELKRTGDRAFCLGINALMLHAAAHNPWPNAKPGMTFGMWGTWWTPGQTWWKDGATALFRYFARCQSLLQYGNYVDNYQALSPTLITNTKGIEWIHRSDDETDIFFISNVTDSNKQVSVLLNVDGRIPEIWNPEIGLCKEAEAWESMNGITNVSLLLNKGQSQFVVLRKRVQDKGPGLDIPSPKVIESFAVDRPWTIRFEDDKEIVTDQLFAWNEYKDKDIRYFSGTARYKTKIQLKKKETKVRYLIDLGEVKNLAVVRVNGHQCTNLWRPPFEADITESLHQGDNEIEIDVTNLWVNRLIGDEQEDDDVVWSEPFSFNAAQGNPFIGRFMESVPDWLSKGLPRPSKNRKAIISFKFYEKDAPLQQSGLLGPVFIRVIKNNIQD